MSDCFVQSVEQSAFEPEERTGYFDEASFFMKEKSAFALIDLNGDSLGARTPDPLIKSQ